MTATEKVFSVLRNAAGITALVPDTRIKPHGDWQNLPLPYIVQFCVPGLQPTHCHDGPKALRISRHQVSVFALDESTAETIGRAVVTTLDGYSDSDVDRIALNDCYALGYDTDLKVAHYAIDFEIAGALA